MPNFGKQPNFESHTKDFEDGRRRKYFAGGHLSVKNLSEKTYKTNSRKTGFPWD